MSVAGSLVVAGALAVALAGKGGEFVAALGSAPLWVLGAAVGAVCFASWAVVDRFRRQPTPAGALW